MQTFLLVSEVGSKINSALQPIFEQLNKLSDGQEELVKDIRVSQDKLAASQELKKDINGGKDKLAA
jgi:hypothetical protein